ncbi:homoserine kinase [Terrihabitans soli]|uniref:Homoserine kinase n=1 Tax=Terrihabitans soli TaxID=708113 RepID=A0A6S6QUJ3_9HYPH|nr:homoserine kinase [Terrihabitans soli]BCJ90158.1 homoserine kinase [Terrihabitans soli]
MAVYTDVPEDDLARFLAAYDLGHHLTCKGIAEGVENSNFLLRTEGGQFILTLYEKRVKRESLPYFLGLMEHAAEHGITCPLPVKNRDGKVLGELCGRPAAIVTFLDGISRRRPTVEHAAQVGDALARFHNATFEFQMCRDNDLSLEGWQRLADGALDRANEVRTGLANAIAEELSYLSRNWPKTLPKGTIHADLFPDNVLFVEGRAPGLIDFYFACTDILAYDLSICLNAWCFEPDHSYNATKGRALLAAYHAARPLREDEIEALPLLARGSAMRFLLTRLIDWLSVPTGALVQPKDPLEYWRKLRFHQTVNSVASYGWEI